MRRGIADEQMIITQAKFDEAKELGFFCVKMELEPVSCSEFIDIDGGMARFICVDPLMCGHASDPVHYIDLPFIIGDELYVGREWDYYTDPGSLVRKGWIGMPPSTMPISLAKEVLTVTGIECEEVKEECLANTLEAYFRSDGWHYKILTDGGKDGA